MTVPTIPITTNKIQINPLRKPINTNFPGSGDLTGSAQSRQPAQPSPARPDIFEFMLLSFSSTYHRILSYLACWLVAQACCTACCPPRPDRLAGQVAQAGWLGGNWQDWASQVSRSWKIGSYWFSQRIYWYFIGFYWYVWYSHSILHFSVWFHYFLKGKPIR